MMTMRSDTTIAAIATPMGQGGVGVIRISGPLAPIIAKQVTDKELTPRHSFHDAKHHHTRFDLLESRHDDVLDFPLCAARRIYEAE